MTLDSSSRSTTSIILKVFVVVLLLCYYFHARSQSIVTLVPRDLPPVKVLSSRLDFWGLYSTIEFPNAVGFNPSMISLPWRGEDDYSPNFIVVAREEDQLVKVYDRDVRPRSILASLLRIPEYHPTTRDRLPPRGHPLVEASWVTRLYKIVRSDKIHFPKCDPLPEWLHGLQGPEDARVFWSSLGEPLLIYNSLSPDNSDLCRAMYLNDLRTAFPKVGSILAEDPDPAPIRFNESVPLIMPGQEGIQKNWVPFTAPNGDIYFHITLIPQDIYKLNLDGPIPTTSSPAHDLHHFLEPVITNPPRKSNCLSIALHKQKVHQSSPFLDVILCTYADAQSGKCDPHDPKKHLYMGIFNVVHNHLDPYFYEGRILTLNYQYPFNYVSISKPLAYSTTSRSFTNHSGIGSFKINILSLYGLSQQTADRP
jgi:hypothetical protein